MDLFWSLEKSRRNIKSNMLSYQMQDNNISIHHTMNNSSNEISIEEDNELGLNSKSRAEISQFKSR